MSFRPARIRFILTRSFTISVVIIFFLQLWNSFKKDSRSNDRYTTNVLAPDELFWRQLSIDDKELTDEQRIKYIESTDKKLQQNELNWTKIFLDNYARKLTKLDQRDAQTPYKKRFETYLTLSSQEKYDIFEATPVFGREKFCSSTNIFHSQCPYSNCQWTCNKLSLSEENLRRASIFHHVDIKHDEMIEKLQHRSSNDIWILWIDEANRDIKHLVEYKFNWTLSFRQDSEISIGTYGILIEKDRSKILLDASLLNNAELMTLLTNHNIQVTDLTLENRIYTNFRYRHKHALWFVSNCQPRRRLEYYNRLKQFFPINAFGSCVEKICDKNDNCEYSHSHLGLFYLAFESQTCTDYITEKFWRALFYGMIPIVLGPSKQSYLDLGVPQSAFIHVDDYENVKELASYLYKISNDYILYRQYFQWLNQYDVFYDINVLEPIRMCELCMRLNMQKYQDHSFYTDVHEWHRSAC